MVDKKSPHGSLHLASHLKNCN